MSTLTAYGPWELVTGASAAIGAAFAHRLAAEARTWSIRLAPRTQIARIALGVMRGFVPESLR